MGFIMGSDEWYRKKYLGQNFGFERHIKGAYEAGFDKAIEESIKIAKEGHTYTPTSTAHNIAKRIKELKE